MDYNSLTNQEIKRKLVEREVIQNVSYMMQEASEHYSDDDDYLNLIYREDNEPLEELEEELENINDSIMRLYAEIQRLEELWDTPETDIQAGILDTALEWYYNKRDEQEDQRFDLEHDIDTFEPDYREPFEYWVVTDWFARKLEEKGEIVGQFMGFTIWGRCCTGQAILLDGVISVIAEDMEILEGMKNDWSEKPTDASKVQKAINGLTECMTLLTDKYPEDFDLYKTLHALHDDLHSFKRKVNK